MIAKLAARTASAARAASAAGAASALALLMATQAAAAPVAVEPAAQPFQLGSFQLFALRDALNVLDNDGKVFGVDAGPAAVARTLQAAGAPTDRITLAVDALLVKEPGRILLLDTGLGPSAHGVLMQSLALAGVEPSQVTTVLITHAHLDHVGGLVTADGKLAFPNATIRMSAKEWAWLQAQPRLSALAQVLAPRVKTFEPGQVVAPGVTAVAIPGHTPGHTGYEIASGGQRLLDMGDTAHSSIVSLAEPDWIIGYDNDPAAGRASRRAMLTRLAASHEPVFAPHFPFPGVGQVVAAGHGFVWSPGLP